MLFKFNYEMGLIVLHSTKIEIAYKTFSLFGALYKPEWKLKYVDFAPIEKRPLIL